MIGDKLRGLFGPPYGRICKPGEKPKVDECAVEFYGLYIADLFEGDPIGHLEARSALDARDLIALETMIQEVISRDADAERSAESAGEGLGQ